MDFTSPHFDPYSSVTEIMSGASDSRSRGVEIVPNVKILPENVFLLLIFLPLVRIIVRS